VEAFAELPFLSAPLLSPDGTRIAGRISGGGSERIGIWTLSEPRDHPPEMFDVGPVESFSWAGDNRLVVSTVHARIMAGGGEIVAGPARRIFAYDLTSHKPTPLGRPHGLFEDMIFVDPYGRYVLVSSQ